MSADDFRARFMFEAHDIRGEIVRLDETLRTVLSHHDYPPLAAGLLGEALAAAALLTGTLKFEGLLTLQARGEGPLTLLVAECGHRGTLRGVVRHEGALPDAPLAQLLGAGHLSITIDPAGGQRYQGIVPLDGMSLAECIEHYFRQSEQLRTRLWLVTGGGMAAGLLLQELPARQGGDADAWNRLCQLADTVTAEELLGLAPEQLLHRLYHEEDVRLFDSDPLAFACSCSRERIAAALRSLGPAELRSILAEQGQVETTCEFCHKTRRFGPEDIQALLGDTPA